MRTPKLSTGTNDRPKDETIAQTGDGLPDDSSQPVDIDEREAARLEQSIRGMGGNRPTGREGSSDAKALDGVRKDANDTADAFDDDKTADENERQKAEQPVAKDIEPPRKGST
jgi:hypothetical protein